VLTDFSVNWTDYDLKANTWNARAASSGQEIAVRLSIGSQAISPISEAITASNLNIKFEIRNIKVD